MNARNLTNLDLPKVLSEENWYDLWHQHVDWKGEGNNDPETRKRFLSQLFSLFEQIEKHISTWKKPTQCWLVIHETDSSRDAIYVHTHNPNRQNYPYEFDDVEWGVKSPEWLAEYVDLTTRSWAVRVSRGCESLAENSTQSLSFLFGIVVVPDLSRCK